MFVTLAAVFLVETLLLGSAYEGGVLPAVLVNVYRPNYQLVSMSFLLSLS